MGIVKMSRYLHVFWIVPLHVQRPLRGNVVWREVAWYVLLYRILLAYLVILGHCSAWLNVYIYLTTDSFLPACRPPSFSIFTRDP